MGRGYSTGRLAVLAVAITVLGACDDSEEASTHAHPDPEGAIERCRGGLDTLDDVPLDERSASLGRACAGLYAEPACRSAMERSGQVPPDRRAATLARACRDAYCPKLDAPLPALCELDFDETHASELPALWSALSHAALTHDMGAERAERVRAMFSATAVVSRPPRAPDVVTPAESPPTLHLAVHREGDTVELTVRRPDGSSSPRALDEIDDRAIAGAIPSAETLGRETGVVIAADPTVPYDTMVTVMDGVRAAGYANVSLSAAPE